jgi:hypothetical protein
MKKLLALLSLSTLISACGGGSSSSADDDVIKPILQVAEIIQVDQSLTIGQSTELVLLAPDEGISNIKWLQTAGEPVTFYAGNSKVIGFSAQQAGDYTFEVSYLQNNSATITLSHTFTVIQAEALLAVRLGHSVIEGNGVSLINYVTANGNGDSIEQSSLKWQQISGPTVSFTDQQTDGKVAVFFDAPQVSEDTLLHFSVTGEISGTSYSDDIAILVENSNISVAASNNAPFSDRKAEVFLYNPSSSAGQKLIDCVYSNEASYDKSCDFNDTPLIAHVTTTPTVDNIMDRVIVSHPWMGDQFKKFLEQYDSEHHDFKNLLRATTAIVISYDIRPSFYHPYTGAIYLDPSDLWETPAQRDTINQAPDYRAAFGSDLQFEMPWRYVKNNDYASFNYPISQRLQRNLSNSLYELAPLLYHELAHANDFFPSTSWHNLTRSKSFLDTVNKVYNDKKIQSDGLQNSYPLDSLYASGGQNEMTKLAQVRFQGENSTSQQRAYTPDDVANLFKTEGAPQFYNYSSTREDYAMLFDGFMMQVRYNVLRDVAVSDQAYDEIFWGQRGRIGETWIKPRVEYVTTRILPELTLASQLIDALDEPLVLDINKPWRESVTIDGFDEQPITSMAQYLLEQSSKVDARLTPKDGRTHHKTIKVFNY